MTATLRLGVFGGTFNPIHLGHLRVAEEAREALELDRVVFVPARLPPHKDDRGIAPPRARLELVRQAIGRNPAFQVCDLELAREGPSYSVHTLRQLQAEAGGEAELWFLLGVDAFQEIHTWYHYAEIFTLANLAVLRRPPNRSLPQLPAAIAEQFTATAHGYRHRSGRELRFLNVTLLDISSTHIRAAIAAGRSVRYLVPEVALEQVQDWNRYFQPRSPRSQN